MKTAINLAVLSNKRLESLKALAAANNTTVEALETKMQQEINEKVMIRENNNITDKTIFDFSELPNLSVADLINMTQFKSFETTRGGEKIQQEYRPLVVTDQYGKDKHFPLNGLCNSVTDLQGVTHQSTDNLGLVNGFKASTTQSEYYSVIATLCAGKKVTITPRRVADVSKGVNKDESHKTTTVYDIVIG